VSVVIAGKAGVELEIRPGGDGLIEIVVVEGPRRHVATFAVDEMDAVDAVLGSIPDTGPVDLGAAFTAAIGRDPFDPATAPPAEPARRGLIADLCALVIGSGLIAAPQALWLRVLAGVVTAVALADLARRAVHHLRA